MKKINSFLGKITAITFLFVMLFNYMPTAAFAAADSVTATVTVGATISITDDAVNLSVANLVPTVANTANSNVLTVKSNVVGGFKVTLTVVDIKTVPVAAQLSNNAAGTYTFATDGTASYIQVTSAVTPAGTLAGTYTTTAEKIDANGVIILDSTANPDGAGDDSTFKVSYEVYADATVTPVTYQGTITFTIAAAA